jgi:single-stranded DNA-binding protein
MSSLESKVLTQVVGRITLAPKLAQSAGGVTVCRFTVATDAGPATNPVVMAVYVQGDCSAGGGDNLAIRCARLLPGDLVRVRGEQRQRYRECGRLRYPEVSTLAREVKLFGRLGHE